MKLAVFGATGKTGTEIIKQSLAKGHSVTAFVRDVTRLRIENERLSIVSGDAFEPISVAKAIQGQDAVICALGTGSDLKKTTVRATGTINILSAMHTHNVNRLVVVTAMGVGNSWNTLSLFNKLIFATLLKSSREDHEAQEVVIMESGLDWTIIRPSGLTETPLTGLYEVGENISAVSSRIARADVADLILRVLEHNTYIGKAVTITN